MLTDKHKLLLIAKLKEYHRKNLIYTISFIQDLVFDVIYKELKNEDDYLNNTVLVKECEDWILSWHKKIVKKVNKIFKTQKDLYENEIKNQRICFDMAMNKGDYKIASVISATIYKMEENIDKFYGNEGAEKSKEQRTKKVISLLDDIEKDFIDLIGKIDE